jgi:pimeloyl-ACP methyl ester carboxylesterase
MTTSSQADKPKPIDPDDYRHLYPFQSHFLSRSGLRYHFVDQGAGHPVVMLHGNPTWSFFFRRIISALAPDYRAIAPDHMGCGLSDKPDERHYDFQLHSRVADFSALMDHLSLDRVTLLVHDWGGMIGMAWAVANPHRVARIIITNTAGFFPPPRKKNSPETLDRSQPEHLCPTRGIIWEPVCPRRHSYGPAQTPFTSGEKRTAGTL